MIRTGLLSAALLVALGAPAAAQPASTTGGWVLGVHFVGATLEAERRASESGGGLGLDASWGLDNGLRFFATVSAAEMRPEESGVPNYALAQADLGLAYTFLGEDARWRPYVDIALTGVITSWENITFGEQGRADIDITGGAISFGGGVQYFLDPRWALFGGLRWSTGSFEEITINDVTVQLPAGSEVDLVAARLQLGFRYHFAGRGL